MNVSVANVALTARPAQILVGVFLADEYEYIFISKTAKKVKCKQLL